MRINKLTNREPNEIVQDFSVVDDPTTVSKSFDSKKVVGNIVSLGSSEIVARAVAFVGAAYLARELGPAGFGIIGFAMALCVYLSLAVSAGFNDLGAREVARRPNKASVIAFSAILARLALASVAMVAIGIVAWFLDKPPTVKLVLVLTGLSFFSLALDTSWVYKGLEQNRRVGLALILGQILYVGTILLVVKGPEDIMLVPLAQFFGEVSAGLLLAVSILRLGEIKLELREGLSILRSSGFLVLSRLLRTIIFTFDVVLLGFLLGEKEVGLYTAPYRICFLLLTIIDVTYVSYLPAVTRALLHSIKRVEYITKRSVGVSAAIAAPMVIGGIVLAGPLLQAVFGPDYLEGAWAFRLLMLSIGFISIHRAIHNILIVSDRLKVEMLDYGCRRGTQHWTQHDCHSALWYRWGGVGHCFVRRTSPAHDVFYYLQDKHNAGSSASIAPVIGCRDNGGGLDHPWNASIPGSVLRVGIRFLRFSLDLDSRHPL